MSLFTKLRTAATGAVFCLALAGAAAAATITGTPSATPTPGWAPNSTNELNYLSLVPGREGQTAPHVLLASTDVGSVTLDFFNFGAGLAFFEIRIDGVTTGSFPHPNPNFAIPDTIHAGGKSVAAGTSLLGQTFSATSTVDVRLALGGERDWDFDWTTFEVGVVPLPAGLPLLLGGLGMIGFVARRRKA